MRFLFNNSTKQLYFKSSKMIYSIKSCSTIANNSTKTTTTSSSSGGSTFLQRLSSFFVGLGIGSTVTFYYIYDELKNSNTSLETHFKNLESRLKALEKK